MKPTDRPSKVWKVSNTYRSCFGLMVWTIRSTGKKHYWQNPTKKVPKSWGFSLTRSPLRPNPILLSAAQVLDLDVEAGVVQLAYLDAEEGSPILDIKPYLPATERIRDAAVPQWCAHWPEFYEDSAAFDWAGEFENAQ
jgi:tRNA (Thr-GGU) A37 N-methylase